MDKSTLSAQIELLRTLKEQKQSLAEQVKENNAQIEQQENAIVASMLDMAEAAGLDDPSAFTVDVEGRRYGVKIKSFYSIRAGDRDRAFPMLRSLGLGDLIVERVDDRTLTRALEEVAGEDGILPDEYLTLPLSSYQRTTITDRKVAK